MTRRVGEHREQQVERLLLVLMGARLALAIGSLGLGVVLDALGGEVPATRFPGFYVTVALCFVAALIYRPFVGRIRRPGAFAAINVVTDLALVSALVFFSGGVHSTFTFLFVVVALYGGVLFPRWGALACSVAGSFGYAVVLSVGHRAGADGALPPDAVGVLVTSWLVHTAALFAAAGLASYLARELLRTGIALDQRTQDLEHLRTLHESTVESLRSGLLTSDLGGRITSFNREAQRITGLSREEALGRPVEDVLPGLSELLAAGEQAGASSRARMQFKTAHGRALHLGVGAYALHDASGRLDGQVVIFQDVTEVVAMEQDLRRSERLAALGELSASIAHEIRNPLAAISGSIQMMQSGGGPGPESKRLMGIAVREVDRLDRLIAEFLQFARPGDPRLAPLDVGEALDEVLEMYEATRPESIELQVDVEPGLGALADAGQLRQVLWNLVLNASQSMPEGGVLRVEAASSDARAPQGERRTDRIEDEEKPVWAEIRVMDQGAGVPLEVAERVFDPFFTTKAGGTGLGLAIVHRVIADHGGSIRVERGRDGFQTVFRIWLPRIEGTS